MRCGSGFKGLPRRFFKADRAKRPKMIILDETSINIDGETVYLRAAINPESRRILLLRL